MLIDRLSFSHTAFLNPCAAWEAVRGGMGSRNELGAMKYARMPMCKGSQSVQGVSIGVNTTGIGVNRTYQVSGSKVQVINTTPG